MPTPRVTTDFAIIYCVAYGLVLVFGMVGNIFVLAAVAMNPAMRTITNFFITNLAVADLLICIFVVPLTLTNNIFIEWLFGNFLCKLQVWLSGTSVCASVYILVAVSTDRYVAICHPLRYSTWTGSRTLLLLMLAIWTVSGILFIPWFEFHNVILYNNTNNVAIFTNQTSPAFPLCIATFPSTAVQKSCFLVLNIFIAFFVPLCAIVVLYALIFIAVFQRQSMAVDKQATIREQRLRLRVTHMMLAVIVSFVVCWVPVYSLFTFLLYVEVNERSAMTNNIVSIIRPLFQWLSLFNSCLNPILYASFSAKFRLAFLEIIVLPCRRRYGRVRRFAQDTVRRVSSKSTSRISRQNSTGSSFRPSGRSNRWSRRWRQADTTSMMDQSICNGEESLVDNGTFIMSIPLFEKISAV